MTVILSEGDNPMSAIPSLQGVRARINSALSRLALNGLDAVAVQHAKTDLSGALADLGKLIEREPQQRRRLDDQSIALGAPA